VWWWIVRKVGREKKGEVGKGRFLLWLGLLGVRKGGRKDGMDGVAEVAGCWSVGRPVEVSWMAGEMLACR